MTQIWNDFTLWAGPLLPDLARFVIAGAVSVALVLIGHWIIFRLLRHLAKHSASDSDGLLLDRLFRPTRWGLVALALVLVAREIPRFQPAWEKIGGFVLPALVGWIALGILHALIDAMSMRADITVADNLAARRRRTRLSLFNRIATFAIVFIVVGLMLLSIPGVRQIGVTLVASAGLAGLAVGAAAQPALKSIIAGIQMAVTEPIRIDDVVIIDGEWGRIEEIRTTYVVVNVWDQRRLVVPTSKFLEDSFQNWTKTTAELLGTVFLYLDPATKIAPIREKFTTLITAHPKWDKRVQVVQVTDTTRDAIEVRLLMSGRDSGALFDLRCAMREAMLDWLAETQPEAFARTRIAAPDAIALNDQRSQRAEPLATLPPA